MEKHIFIYGSEIGKQIDIDYYHSEFTNSLLISKNQYIEAAYQKSLNREKDGDLVSNMHFVSFFDTIETAHTKSIIMDKIEKYSSSYLFDFPIPTESIYHAGYLEYLVIAWKHDLGIEIAPWHLYYIYLWQYLELVKNDPDRYRNLLSFPESNMIIVDNHFDISKLLDKLVEQNEKLTYLIPHFENQPDSYLECIYGLTGDMTQDYYDITILSCSIPQIEIIGSLSDWNTLYDMALVVYQMFEDFLSYDKKIHFQQTLNYFYDAKSQYYSKDFWENFFSIQRCGSGSQQEISGDILKILLPDKYLLSHVPKYISRIRYQENDQKQVHLSGLFSSQIINGILKPSYQCFNASQVIDVDPLQMCDTKSPRTQFLEWMMKFHNDLSVHSQMSDERIAEYFVNEKKYVGKLDVQKEINKMVEQISDITNQPIDIIGQNLDQYINENKFMTSLETRTKFLEQFNGSIIKYINYKTKQRLELIEKRGCFWYQDEKFMHRNSFSYYGLHLSYDRWLYYLEKQKSLVELITNHPQIMTHCGIDYKYLWKTHLYNTFNAQIYAAFIQEISKSEDEYEITHLVINDIITNNSIDKLIRNHLLLNLITNDSIKEGIALEICENLILENWNSDSLFVPAICTIGTSESTKTFKFEPYSLARIYEFMINTGMEASTDYKYFDYLDLIIVINNNHLISNGKTMTIDHYNQIIEQFKNLLGLSVGEAVALTTTDSISDRTYNLPSYNYFQKITHALCIPPQLIPPDFPNYFAQYMEQKYYGKNTDEDSDE